MQSFLRTLSKPSNQRLISWLGGGGAVVAAGLWAVITYVWPAHEGAKTECVQQGVSIGGNVSGSTVTNTVSSSAAPTAPCTDTSKK